MSLSASSSGSWSRAQDAIDARAGPGSSAASLLAASRLAMTRAPKPSARCATARPMEPRPTMPTVMSRISRRGQRLPGPLALQLQQLGQPTDDGQHHHQHVLGDGLGEDAARVGDDQAPTGGRGRRALAPRPQSRSGPSAGAGSAPGAGRRSPPAAARGASPRRRRAAPSASPSREMVTRRAPGGRGADALQVRLAVARRQDGRQRDGCGHAAGAGAGHQAPLARRRSAGVAAQLRPCGATRSHPAPSGRPSPRRVGSDRGPSHRWPMAASPPAAYDAGHEALAAPVLLHLQVQAGQAGDDPVDAPAPLRCGAPRSARGCRPRPAAPARRPRP